jgi:hypothetical protein
VTYNGPWQWQLSPIAWTNIPAGTFTPFVSQTGLDSYRFHLPVVTPEPGSLAGLAAGLGLIALVRLRRRT